VIRIEHGDSRKILKRLADNSVSSVVTDPPYALVSIGKRFGAENAAPAKAGKTGAYARASAGFMGQKWDTGDTAFDPAFWVEVMRVLKPGGHVVAFGGTRTYHRLACAIEDAGFEIRDMVGWLYGSGFPKSHNVSKGIDKAAGAERDVVGTKVGLPGYRAGETGPNDVYGNGLGNGSAKAAITAPATDAARQWEGWGTALKPAQEPICLARKPLVGTVAANVLQHGTGALNIDGCRVETADDLNGGAYAEVGGRGVSGSLHAGSGMNVAGKTVGKEFVQPPGRWPANVIHDGSDEVSAAFPRTSSGKPGIKRATGSDMEGNRGAALGAESRPAGTQMGGFGDDGSAARFFYSAKADADDRLGSKHPTVKPVDLMRWLVRLVTPPGGLVLDPFAGSGSTGMACMAEGFDCILIEREAAYIEDIRRRVAHVSGLDGALFAGGK
jgi:DNA modification methylase